MWTKLSSNLQATSCLSCPHLCLFLFLIGSHAIAQAAPEFVTVLLPQSPAFWDYRCEPLIHGLKN